jgi:hypothetical protein
VASVFDFRGVQFIQVRTGEANGVLHVLWAWHGERSFYVPQPWLSAEWKRIHGAPIVDIRPVKLTKDDQRKLSRYIMTQYCATQRSFEHLSWSWWAVPFALARGWETLKTLGRETYGQWPHVYVHYTRTMAELIACWERLLESGGGMLGDTLLEFREREVVEVF